MPDISYRRYYHSFSQIIFDFVPLKDQGAQSQKWYRNKLHRQGRVVPCKQYKARSAKEEILALGYGMKIKFDNHLYQFLYNVVL